MSEVPWAVLATDGAFNTMEHLGADWDEIAQSGSAELARILEHCQRWEVDEDPQARALPRSKRHDDKAIAAIRLGA